MAEFQYVAQDAAGKKVEGRLEANNEGELRMLLRSKGLRPTRISKVALGQVDVGAYLQRMFGGTGSVPADRLMNFVKQLQTMIASGVPLVQAIELFLDQESHPYMKMILTTFRERLNGGSFLWECMSAYPDVFERVFVALVRAGESSGTLDVMLKRSGKYLENSYRLKRLIKSSMNYPIVVSVIAVGVITLMLTMVIPKFEAMIVSNGGELPGPTKFVIALSHGLINNFHFVVLAAGALVYLVRSYVKTEEGRVVLQNFALRLPVFGPLIIQSGVARFTRTMATLLASGVPMVDALEICKAASSHVAYEDAIKSMKREVELGATFSNAMLRQQALFPKMAIQMTVVGESTGNMDKMLERVAEFYEEEVETSIQGMLKLIEPFMLVFMGGIVGGLLIAMYLPVFQMAGNAGN